MEASPNNPVLLGLKMDTWRRKGNYKEAVEAWAKLQIVNGDPQGAVNGRRAFNQGGVHGFVRWELNKRLKQSNSRYVSPVELAGYYAQLGEEEQTLALLNEGYRQHSTDALWVQDDPAYDFLHDEPRYRALIQKIGRPTAN
jgi:predicted Zn-dependent protease